MFAGRSISCGLTYYNLKLLLYLYKKSKISYVAYEAALDKSWEELSKFNVASPLNIKFLADEYTVDFKARKVISLACNAPARPFAAILILHYSARKLCGLPGLTGDWLSFKELSGVEGYYPAFRKRAIEPIIRKYASNAEGMLGVLDRLPGKRINQGDVGVVLEAFEGVPVAVLLWRPDEEFAAEANMLFDRSITGIFCTEDIVVLAGIVAGAL